MKKQNRLLLIIVASVLFVFIGISLALVFVKDSSGDSLLSNVIHLGDGTNANDDSDDEDSVKPELEVEILDYREHIATTCDKVTIKIKLTNVGEVAVSYSDVTSGKYNISVVTDDVISWSSRLGMNLTNFGELAPGQSAEVTLSDGEFLGNEDYGYFDNNFRVPDDNGTYDMRVDFEVPNEGSSENYSYTIFGQSDSVDLLMDIYDSPSENLLKECYGTL